MVSALWCRYCAASNDSGEPITLNDPNAERLELHARAAREDPQAFLSLRDIFGDLADDAGFRTRFGDALRSLWSDGTRSTLQRYLSGA